MTEDELKKVFNQTYFSNSTDDNVLFDDLNIKDDATIKACVPNFPYVFFDILYYWINSSVQAHQYRLDHGWQFILSYGALFVLQSP